MRRGPALLLALVLVPTSGCAPSPVEPPQSFVEYLESNDQQFVSVPAPGIDVVSPELVVQTLLRDGFPPFAIDRTADPPILGVVRCGPACRGDGGFLGPGQERLVWIVGFPRASGANGGTAWAVVDAVSGSFIVGDGPPGP